MRSANRNAQRGVALLTSVMIVAMATTLAAGMLVRQNLIIHRTANIDQFGQAWWYLVGLEEWAGELLRRDREETEVDSLDEPWALAVDFIPVDEGALGGQIVDLQGRFNLNSLGAKDPAGTEAQERLVLLIRAIEELQTAPAEEIAAAARDWIDDDVQPRFPGGAEDSVYLGLEPAYRTGNRLFESPSELLLVQGVTREIWPYLAPHVTVLPVTESQINVNTATVPVLMSLNKDLTLPEVEGLITKREETPWESIQEFLQEPVFAGRQLPENQLDVKTSYFQAQGTASIGNIRTRMSAMLQRGADGKVVVLARSRDAL